MSLPLPGDCPVQQSKTEILRQKGAGEKKINRKGKGKGKKGKGKKGRESHVQTWVPPRLRGGKPVDSSGQPICFNYNLEGCEAARPGQSCPRGLHVWCKCFKVHPFTGNREPETKPAAT